MLVESRWEGGKLHAAVIGIGINIAPESVNPLNLSPAGLNFPATCIDSELGHKVDSLELLFAILEAFNFWLPRLDSPTFIQAWEDSLAYKDQWVELSTDYPGQSSTHAATSQRVYSGKVIGLAMDGSLKLITRSGESVSVQVGELHLAPTPVPD